MFAKRFIFGLTECFETASVLGSVSQKEVRSFLSALVNLRRYNVIELTRSFQSFAEKQLDGWPRFTLLQALLSRTTTLEEILDAALALVPMASNFTVERDWGPLLLRAFPRGNATEVALTAAQRQLLTAIADKDDCWGNIGNKIAWLRKAGLPTDRASFRALVTDAGQAADN